MENKRYFQLVSGEDTADLYIFGDICSWAWPELGEQSGVTIVEQLKAVSAKNINVHINSYGGDVAEGLAIYNTLRNHAAHITTICDGFACSAASVVFMAGDDRIMSPASLLMIHNAWTSAVGNAEELRKVADDIETITQASVEAYKQHATISEEEIKQLMDAETWILPQDAVNMGFASAIDEVEEDDGAKQSAFNTIMHRLTEPRQTIKVSIDTELLADELVKRMNETKHEEPAPEMSAWDKFFKGVKS